MKISEVKYSRKYNLGNYESEDYGITAVLEDDENANEVLEQLKKEVQSVHSGQTQETTNAGKTNARRGRSETEIENPQGDGGSSIEEEIEGEEVEEEIENAETEEVPNEENEEETDEEIETPAPPPARGKQGKNASNKKPSEKSASSTVGSGTKTAGKTFKKKAQVYQRSNETHKDLFSKVLRQVAPDWKANDKSKARGKDASVKMEGVDFLDADGNVLDSFKQSVKKLMAAKK